MSDGLVYLILFVLLLVGIAIISYFSGDEADVMNETNDYIRKARVTAANKNKEKKTPMNEHLNKLYGQLKPNHVLRDDIYKEIANIASNDDSIKGLNGSPIYFFKYFLGTLFVITTVVFFQYENNFWEEASWLSIIFSSLFLLVLLLLAILFFMGWISSLNPSKLGEIFIIDGYLVMALSAIHKTDYQKRMIPIHKIKKVYITVEGIAEQSHHHINFEITGFKDILYADTDQFGKYNLISFLSSNGIFVLEES